MKKLVPLLYILLVTMLAGSAQELSFSKQLVDDNFNGPAGIFIADLDNDSLKDVIAAGADGHTIAWYKNKGGYPVEWSKQIIDDDFKGAIYVQSGDIDGDGFMDVLGAAWWGSELAYWRNNGEDPIEWTKYTIKSNYDDAHEIMPYDLDQDGDLDVLGVSAARNKICWYENDGNFPVNWTEHAVSTMMPGARSIDAADIDGDGDIDLVGAALLSNEIAWFRNEGTTPITWRMIIISSTFQYAHKVQIIDMDDDGNLDILGTAYSEGISWFRNDGGDDITWSKQFVDYYNSAVIACAFDPDQDGDLDIVGSAQGTNKLGFWKNDGNFPFTWDYDLIDDLDGAWPLACGDLDNDGDLDMVCGGKDADEIRWYENDLITSLEPAAGNVIIKPGIKCHPMPFNDEVKITLSLIKNQYVKIQVMNISGQVINTLAAGKYQKGEHQFTWPAHDNNPGMYFAQIVCDDQKETVRLIKTR